MTQTEAMQRFLVIGIAVVAVAAAAAYFLYENPCSDFLPCRDSPSVVAVEEHALLRQASEMYVKVVGQSHVYHSLEILPKPLQVRVTESNALLMTDGPVSAGSLEYAAIWYDVYHRYHRGTRTVHLRIAWKSGSLTQLFPLTEF
jgi:hypothetical protein